MKGVSAVFPGGVLLVFLAMRLGFPNLLDQFGVYASYVFESLFVIGVAVAYRSSLRWHLDFSARLALQLVLAVSVGFLIFRGAPFLGVPVPFDFSAAETMVLLLLVAPVLEELIFRMAIWQLLLQFVRDQRIVLILTSLLFSFAHFVAFWAVPAEFKGFVLYQSIYTAGLGLWCGGVRMRAASPVPAILVHGAFNLGFFAGSWI